MPFSWKIYLSGDRTAEDGLVIPVGAGGKPNYTPPNKGSDFLGNSTVAPQG